MIQTLLCFIVTTHVSAKKVEVKPALEGQSLVLNEAIDLHLTSTAMPLKKSTVNLNSENAWLFFDNVRPSVVLAEYSRSILVNGIPFRQGIGGNGRIAVYKQGTVVIPHSDKFQPLETFTDKNFGGAAEKYSLSNYYTNKLSKDIPANLKSSLKQDNSIQSFRLKRGYMVTFATEPDGTGYSRIFIADSEDIIIQNLPVNLKQKISYIRVFPWQWPSKKGWCGGRGRMVESNGRDRQENEISLTQSTWAYSWGADDPLSSDFEYVPMKWGYGGSFETINSRTGVTHLLGYNEPNRPDQSKMTVEQALQEWPQLMKSGLRLGSPSVSDNSCLEDWLYKFMDECKKRNYRVDYVAVHAYWGPDQMKSPEEWYKKLQEIHLRTGKPIWLTEWNIGANWTKEPWPNNVKDQQAKMIRDLKNILTVLDTASFVERYSIYNWVENKRAMIVDSFCYKTLDGKKVEDKLLNQEITPAGEFYRNNHPDFAFNRKNEVISTWQFTDKPKLTYDLSERNEIQLHWNMKCNPEMIGEFIVERSTDNNEFKEITQINSSDRWLYFEGLMNANKIPSGSVYYRVRGIDLSKKESLISNVISYNYLKNKQNSPTVGNLVTPTNWSMFVFKNNFEKDPIVVFGTPTNRNQVPQTHRIKNLGKNMFDFKLDTWEYLKDPIFENMDTIAYIVLPRSGAYDFKGITAFAGKVSNATPDGVQIHFETPFKEIPVVFASQITNHCDSTTSVRIKNITTEGFEVQLQYEAGITPPAVGEDICYIAITPGIGSINGKNLKVGRTEEGFVGDYFGAGRIEFGKEFANPAIFVAMQTNSDNVTSALRMKNHEANSFEVFKEKETSKGSKPIFKESIGWMIIESNTK